MQWRYKAADAPGQCLPDGDIMVKLFEKIRALYAKDGGAFPEPIQNLRWDHSHGGHFDPHAVAKLINGYFEADVTIADKTYKKGTPVPAFAMLQADGSTSSGNWVYTQSYTDKNLSARRGKKDPTGLGLYPEWSWCWPVNRRILYNRASVDIYGRPLDDKKNILEWKDGKWVGDIPDGPWPPMADKEKGKLPFIMRADGLGAIFGPGLADGPFPEHYEPLECPVEKNLMYGQRINPTAPVFKGDADAYASCDPRFPFVGTTYRVTEHWQTGVMTRWQPWLLECEPQMFVEMSEELAQLKSLKNGETCLVSSARGKVEAVAIVTKRFKPFNVHGQVVHEVGLPWHFGWVHPKYGGDSANLLTPSTGDPNTRIPESKAFMVNVAKLANTTKKGGK
jgi:formate dehydrogenase major subunit